MRFRCNIITSIEWEKKPVYIFKVYCHQMATVILLCAVNLNTYYTGNVFWAFLNIWSAVCVPFNWNRISEDVIFTLTSDHYKHKHSNRMNDLMISTHFFSHFCLLPIIYHYFCFDLNAKCINNKIYLLFVSSSRLMYN